MKHESIFLSVPLALALSISCCQKKSAIAPVNNSDPTVKAVEPASPDQPAPALIVANPTARAAKLGFAQILSKDTEALVLVQNGAEVAKLFKGSKLWSFIKEQNPALGETGNKEEATGGADEVQTPTVMDFLGQEFFIATGKSSSVQAGNFMTFSNRINYFQLRSTLKMMIASITSEPGIEEMEPPNPLATMAEFVKDPESGVKLLEKIDMPPLFVGFKTTPENKEKLGKALSGMVANLALAGSSVEEISFEVDGRTFGGNQLSGKKLAEDLQADESAIEEMDKQFGAETRKNLFKVLAKKNLIAVSGLVNDYAVLFIGTNKEDLKFAASPAESMAGSAALAFVDPYLEKNPVAVMYSEKGVLQSFATGSGISNLAHAVRDAISGNGKVDTREIEALLDVVAEREKELLGTNKFSNFGGVALLEDGFKLETFGGGNLPNLMAETSNKLGALGEAPDVAMFANWTSNEAYGLKMKSYLEAIVETSYSIAKNVSTWDVKEQESFKQFKGGFTMFEENFSKDAAQLWDTLSDDVCDGLGNETALVVDLNGEMPAIPNVPQELVKEGKFPRISWVKPVVDRAKLAGAWGKLNSSGENIMKQISKMMEKEQAMPKPMKSEKNDLTTWFFSLPLMTEDFSPSITLNDKWFIASTSKLHAVSLAGLADKSQTGKTGAYLSMDFDSLRKCANHWLESVAKNKEVIFKDNTAAADDFTANQVMFKSGIEAFSDLDQLTIHTRRERGTERSSLHLKTQ
jgi:hypothetical protein